MILRDSILEQLRCSCGQYWGPDDETSLLGYQPRLPFEPPPSTIADRITTDAGAFVAFCRFALLPDGRMEIRTNDDRRELIHRCPQGDPRRTQIKVYSVSALAGS